ncbi:MAG: hypothetical protein OXG90_09745 [Gammaproteobacteria bacterium]|nr:hypothetical protein [Gammaproteobacteria bacterium]
MIDLFAAAAGREPGYVGKLLYGSGDFYARLRRGAGITLKHAARVVQAASDNWPAGAPWPQSIPRPQPSPDSPAAREAEAAAANRGSADDEALRLGADGRLADPRALARRMAPYEIQVQAYLDSYYHVVSAYHDGGARAGKRPRRKSRAMEILGALIAAGDVRFASRDPGPKGRALLRSTLPARTEPLL